jgi:hypothetical protein
MICVLALSWICFFRRYSREVLVKRLIRTLSVGAWVLSLVSPNAPASAQDEWDLVYIGQSGMPEVTRLYGERIEADLGVSVRMWQRNSALIPFATIELKSGEWSIVDDAEIVIVNMSTEFGRREGVCLDTQTEALYPQTPGELRAEIDDFLAELTRHVDPANAIIRIALLPINPGYKSIWIERDVVGECAAGKIALDEQWIEAAANYGIPVMNALVAWNGTDGKQDAPEEYYYNDSHHALTAEGSAKIAELLRAVGYAPLAQ